jgi:hypothetical protein
MLGHGLGAYGAGESGRVGPVGSEVSLPSAWPVRPGMTAPGTPRHGRRQPSDRFTYRQIQRDSAGVAGTLLALMATV